MKKFRTRITAFLLCLLMITGSVYQVPMTVSASSVAQDHTGTEEVLDEVAGNETATDGTEDTETVTEDTVTAPKESAKEDSTVSDNNPADSDEGTVPTGTGDITAETDSSATDADDGNSEENDETEDNDTVTLTFYDSDETTVLFSFTIPKGDNLGGHMDEVGYLYDPVKRGYALNKWYRMDNGKTYSSESVTFSSPVKKDLQYKAVWSTKPYRFDIEYITNKGKIIEDSYPETFTVESETITLPTIQRKNYIFDGWYTDSAYTTAVTTIPKGTYIDSDDNGEVAPYTLYAKWTKAKPGQMKKPSAKNSGTGKIKVSFTKLSGADGYEVTYSTDKNVKKNTLTKTLSKSKSSLTLSNLPKGKTYYFKVRAYKLDSTGAKCYGTYSAIRSCKVTKGVTEYTATSSSGKLNKVSVKNQTDLYVTATVSKRLKSSDDWYYLVKVDPNSGKILKQIAKTDKTKTVVFQLPLKDEKGNNHIQGKFGVAVKKDSKYMLITSTSYINNPQDAAAYTGKFPTPASKKGRQGLYEKNLGDKNYFMNFCLDEIIATKESHSVAYKYNGKTYYFYEPSRLYSVVSDVNKDGGTVTIQLMLRWNERSKDLILPSGRTPGANYYAFNTDQKAAREKIEAAFCFLAEKLSQEDRHVDNWIIGNEVNTYANPTAKWYYAGNISHEKFIENYASTFRMLYYAVRSNSKNSRVYICCDHTWINREQDWGTKYFTKAFHDEIKSQNKNIKWNLAYHAYSAVLTNADFWNDGKLAPNNENADFVSPNNLEILTDYVKKNFGKDVRIILSEQGFSYSGGVGSPYNNGRQTGESVQAAAIAWLYYKAQFNDMIDAVIYLTSDHGGAAGFQFNVIDRKAENVYKYMDTPKYSKYTKDCLKTIGKSSWSDCVRNFSDKKMKKMPTR